MTTASFDDLVEALQGAVISAQESLRRREQAILEECAGRDGRGAPRGRTASVSIPGGMERGGDESVAAGLADVRGPRHPEIAELTVSFDCVFRLIRRGRGSAARYKMRLAGGRRWWGRRARRRVEIGFRGREGPVGYVSVDGFLLKEVSLPNSVVARETEHRL